MEKVFGAVLHLSLIGSYTVLLVVLLRFLRFPAGERAIRVEPWNADI